MNTFENSGWQPKWMNEWCFFFWKKFFLKTAKNENENYIFMFCIQPSSSSSSSNWIERYRTWMFSYWPNKKKIFLFFFSIMSIPHSIVLVLVCVGEMKTFGSFFFARSLDADPGTTTTTTEKRCLGHTHTPGTLKCVDGWCIRFFSTIIKWWIELRSFRFFVRFWHCKTDQIDCVQANWKQK